MSTEQIARAIREILWRHAPEFYDPQVEILAVDIARHIEQVCDGQQNRSSLTDRPNSNTAW